ncbi:MAG: hypothetical protein M1818_002088 [Claussenomyces sp. TS43310]|nr:MAG: hypothetical protein M1818_002088 [Claussenomyces sp. TS43310]
MLSRRDDFGDDGDDDYVSFWWTDRGESIRWAIFASIVGILVLYMVFGYMHAQRRIKKGLPPLTYHRWLLSRRRRARLGPSANIPLPNYSTHQPNEYYGSYAPPPPVYDPNFQPPPTYQPPEGSKTDSSQWQSAPTRRPETAGEAAPEYTPPPGPPPAVLRAESYR